MATAAMGVAALIEASVNEIVAIATTVNKPTTRLDTTQTTHRETYKTTHKQIDGHNGSHTQTDLMIGRKNNNIPDHSKDGVLED